MGYTRGLYRPWFPRGTSEMKKRYGFIVVTKDNEEHAGGNTVEILPEYQRVIAAATAKAINGQ